MMKPNATAADKKLLAKLLTDGSKKWEVGTIKIKK